MNELEQALSRLRAGVLIPQVGGSPPVVTDRGALVLTGRLADLETVREATEQREGEGDG